MNNDEMEFAVVGALLLDPSVLPIVSAALTPRKFASPKARMVYEAILALDQAKKPIDVLTVKEYLSRPGADKNKTLLEEIGDLEQFFVDGLSVPSISAYVQSVADNYTKRRLVELATEAIKRVYENGEASEILAQLQSGLANIQAEAPTRVESMRDVAVRFAERLKLRLTRPEEAPRGYSTGILNLDKILGQRFEPGRLITVAGRPGTGKSQVLTAMALSLATQGIPVLFFSLEMDSNQLMNRMLAYLAEVDSEILADEPKRLTQAEIERVVTQLSRFADGSYPLDVQTGARDVLEIQAQTRQYAAKMKAEGRQLGAMFLDYVGLVPPLPGVKRRDQEVSDVTRTLKLMTLDPTIHCPIVEASQMNRQIEMRADKRPLLSDLRESGSLEQDSDVVIFTSPCKEYMSEKEQIATDKKYPPGWEPFELIVAKNRDGRRGKALCMWNRSTGRFRSIQEEER